MTLLSLDRAGEDRAGLRGVRQSNWVRTATRNQYTYYITERSFYSKVTALTALVRPSDAKQHAFINPSAQNEDAVRARCLCSHSNYY